jgi:hypothetical protein
MLHQFISGLTQTGYPLKQQIHDLIDRPELAIAAHIPVWGNAPAVSSPPGAVHRRGSGRPAAAYNAGSQRVRQWLARRQGLPRETQQYVRVITGQRAEEWTLSTTAGALLEASPDIPWRTYIEKLLLMCCSRVNSKTPPEYERAAAVRHRPAPRLAEPEASGF